jgi:hypothetical protein
MNDADFTEMMAPEIFGIADDLLKAQQKLISHQNELIARLMDRIDMLEHGDDKLVATGIKGAL